VIDPSQALLLAAKLRGTAKPSAVLRAACAQAIEDLAKQIRLRGVSPLAAAIGNAGTAARLDALPALSGTFAPGPPAPSDLRSWAAWVLAEAAHVAPWNMNSDKRFFSDVWARVGTRAAPSLEAFKQKLIEAHRAGFLRIARADLVEAMPPGKVDASEARYMSASFHFLLVPEPRRSW